jgi:N-acetylmuramoyl-L-alanine amidase
VAERIDGVESEVVRYGYGADGRLCYRKQASPEEELYLVSDGDQVVIERTASAVQRTYVWAGSTLLKTRALGGLELHLHQDRLGSVVLATQAGSSGAELHRRVQFDPYGRRVSSGAWEGPGRWDRYGYAGARWDASVGLYLMGARWYAPEMGRFLELDPIGEGGGWNLYNYVGSSPTLWVDPTGLSRQRALTPAQEVERAQAAHSGDGKRHSMLGRAPSQGFHTGMKVYIDGVNTNDMATGNQVYNASYTSSAVPCSSRSGEATKNDAPGPNRGGSGDQNTNGNGDSPVDLAARGESTNGSSEPADSRAPIVIDPGHGDHHAKNKQVDPGAVADGSLEKDITLDISKATATTLEAAGRTVVLTREGDVEDAGQRLRWRTDKAEGAEIFVSVHINASEDIDARGLEVFYRSGDEKSQALAQAILDTSSQLDARRIVATENLAVLNLFKGTAVLVEAGFMTNPDDLAILRSSSSRIGQDIAQGVINYLGGSP